MSAEEYRTLFHPRGQHMEGVPELADEEYVGYFKRKQ